MAWPPPKSPPPTRLPLPPPPPALSHLLRLGEGVVGADGHGQHVLVAVDDGVGDGGHGGVANHQAHRGDVAQGSADAAEQELVSDVQHLGLKQRAVVVHLSTQQQQQQRCFVVFLISLLMGACLRQTSQNTTSLAVRVQPYGPALLSRCLDLWDRPYYCISEGAPRPT